MKPTGTTRISTGMNNSRIKLRSLSRMLPRVAAVKSSTEGNAASLLATRRSLLSVPIVSGLVMGLIRPQHAAAAKLRSMMWERPCELTVVNGLEHVVKIYWINYDGDLEFYGAMNPGSTWSVQTFESHPWRFIDAQSNSLVQDFVVNSSSQVLRLSGGEAPENPSSMQANEDLFDGFDGVGGTESQYAEAKVSQVSLQPSGGVATIAVNGYMHSLEISIGAVEAMAMLHAAGVEMRRPSTVNTWTRTLKATGATVERVCITRLVSDVFYSRIVGRTPEGAEFSIDSRPSDSLALALQLRTPIYVSCDIARLHDEVVEAYQKMEAKEVEDSVLKSLAEITKILPGAPQPYDLSFDRAKEA